MDNPYFYDVDPHEILDGEENKTFGERLTTVDCKICQKPLSEANLADIRRAFAPCAHYDCYYSKE